MKLPAVFLDRDGVIIQEKHFSINVADIEFIPGAIEALRALAGYLKIVISNQSGVARGYFTCDDVDAFQRVLAFQLAERGVEIASWRFCPHDPNAGCKCRKPKPGMILDEAEKMSVDLAGSWMIGDKTSDIEAGKSAGVKTILVRTGYAGKEPDASSVVPDYSADDLKMAVEIINSIT